MSLKPLLVNSEMCKFLSAICDINTCQISAKCQVI